MESRKKRFNALGLRWSRTRDRGATAVVIALCLLLLMGAAAVAFDTANLALKRQTLANIVDSAAQAGAADLPGNPSGAVTDAQAYAHRSDPALSISTTLYCVVDSLGTGPYTVNYAQIPSTCNPGGSGTYTSGVGGTVCDQNLCAIPCVLTGTNPVCNTMKVSAAQNVPFYFAPAIGIPSGNTGSVVSVSCKGSCGTGMPNPLDVAIVADRTSSLDSTVFSQMQAGILSTLATMTPELQFVTIGAIHKSTTQGTCETYLPTNNSSTPADQADRAGNWMTSSFSNNYLTGTYGGSGRTLKTAAANTLVNNISCMNQATQPWGTHLAAPMKAAARMLLGPTNGGTTSNLATLSTARAALLPPGVAVKKVLIMETDGVPEETEGFNGYLVGNSGTLYKDTNTSKGDTLLTDGLDPTSGNPASGDVGCANLLSVASAAKAAGITVIMVGYGDANTAKCKKNYSNGTYSGNNVDDTMAAAASPTAAGTPSAANNDCTTTAGAAAENADGDNYFCAASGSQLAGIFSTAINQINNTTKFIKLPQ